MCGIVGIIGGSPVNQAIYDGLTLLQHRGQDAAGIVTIDEENRFRLRKANGLVSEVFRQEHMLRLQVCGHRARTLPNRRQLKCFRSTTLLCKLTVWFNARA